MPDPSTMAREVAEWLGWRVSPSSRGTAVFITGERLTQRICLMDAEVSTLHAAIVRERELREALEFYATARYYPHQECDAEGNWYDSDPGSAMLDNGRRARTALKEKA